MNGCQVCNMMQKDARYDNKMLDHKENTNEYKRVNAKINDKKSKKGGEGREGGYLGSLIPNSSRASGMM